MKLLIAGQDGQLGREFARLAPPGFTVEAPDEKSFDITNPEAIRNIIAQCRPDVLINCAAYNQVDEAEKNTGPAFAINTTGVGHLAAACKQAGVKLIHYGTDYVFDGEKGTPYTEEDAVSPINKYGESKLAGERLVLQASPSFLLFRASWVFGEGKQNFLYKLLQWAQGGNTVRVVDDQVSTPTSTRQIVRLTLLALQAGLSGLYHMTASGYASRYEIARYFFEKAGLTNEIIPVPTDYFPSPASRPRFSALSNAKLAATLGIAIPDWKQDVESYAKLIVA